MSFAEFNEWILYFRDSPPLKDMLNLCTANIAYTVYSMNRGKGGKKLTIEDFIFKPDNTAEMTDEEKNFAMFEQLKKAKYVKVKNNG